MAMDTAIVVRGLRLIAESNRSEHWTVKGKRVKAEKEAVSGALARLGVSPIAPSSAVIVSMTRIAPRLVDDDDNLVSCFKHVRDAIAQHLGLKSDNDPRVLRWECRQRKSERAREYGLEIRIRETTL